MEQQQEQIEERRMVGRRGGIRYDRGRLPPSGGGALDPPPSSGIFDNSFDASFS